MTLWIEDATLECYQVIGPDGQVRYREAAIQTSLMLRITFKLALRQTECLMTSVLSLMDLRLSAPDHNTVSRWAATLRVIQTAQVPHGLLHVLIDSTGLQAYLPDVHGDGVEMVIPPRATAVLTVELDPPTQRDRHLTMTTEHSRLVWQTTTNYGRRSLVEMTMGH